MTRERTTWNRHEIKQQIERAAKTPKPDPFLINYNRPYLEATPSTWADHGAAHERIFGEAPFVPTPRDIAAENLLVKKADLGVKVARMFLPNLSESDIEDQAVALMNLSDSDLIDTYQRLIADQEAATSGVETRQ